MALKTQQQPAMTIVGLNIRTKPMAPDIPALWPKFVARIAEIGNASEPGVAYGVMRGDAQVLQYMAGVAVSRPGPIPNGMESVTVPAGTYAVFSYPISQLGKGFGEIYNTLLPASGLRAAPGPSLERYGAEFKPQDPNAPVAILVPVNR